MIDPRERALRHLLTSLRRATKELAYIELALRDYPTKDARRLVDRTRRELHGLYADLGRDRTGPDGRDK